MSEIDSLVAISWFVLKLALVLALPMVALELGEIVLRRFTPRDFFKIPFVSAPAKLLGIVAGVMLVYVRYDRRFFDLHDLFVPESVWNLTLAEFFAERVNPLNYGIGRLIDYANRGQASETFLLLAGLATVLAVWALIAPFLFWPQALAWRALLCSVGMAALAAYLAIYVICLLFWSLFVLNFWTFALIGVAFQYYRRKA